MQGKADTSRSQRTFSAEDLTSWVLETYPWSQPAPSPLMRLEPQSDDFVDHNNCCQSASNRSLPATSTNAEDQLVSIGLSYVTTFKSQREGDGKTANQSLYCDSK